MSATLSFQYEERENLLEWLESAEANGFSYENFDKIRDADGVLWELQNQNEQYKIQSWIKLSSPGVFSVNGLGGQAIITQANVITPITLVTDETYNVTSADYILHVVGNQNGPCTLFLPVAKNVPGQRYIIKDAAGMAHIHNIVVARWHESVSDHEMFDGTVSQISITKRYGTLEIYSYAGSWWIASQY